MQTNDYLFTIAHMSRIRPVDDAFKVIMPNEGKDRLWAITVFVKAPNQELAIHKMGEAKLYGKSFSIEEAFEDEDGNISNVPPKSDIN